MSSSMGVFSAHAGSFGSLRCFGLSFSSSFHSRRHVATWPSGGSWRPKLLSICISPQMWQRRWRGPGGRFATSSNRFLNSTYFFQSSHRLSGSSGVSRRLFSRSTTSKRTAS